MRDTQDDIKIERIKALCLKHNKPNNIHDSEMVLIRDILRIIKGGDLPESVHNRILKDLIEESYRDICIIVLNNILHSRWVTMQDIHVLVEADCSMSDKIKRSLVFMGYECDNYRQVISEEKVCSYEFLGAIQST